MYPTIQDILSKALSIWSGNVSWNKGLEKRMYFFNETFNWLQTLRSECKLHFLWYKEKVCKSTKVFLSCGKLLTNYAQYISKWYYVRTLQTTLIEIQNLVCVSDLNTLARIWTTCHVFECGRNFRKLYSFVVFCVNHNNDFPPVLRILVQCALVPWSWMHTGR